MIVKQARKLPKSCHKRSSDPQKTIVKMSNENSNQTSPTPNWMLSRGPYCLNSHKAANSNPTARPVDELLSLGISSLLVFDDHKIYWHEKSIIIHPVNPLSLFLSLWALGRAHSDRKVRWSLVAIAHISGDDRATAKHHCPKTYLSCGLDWPQMGFTHRRKKKKGNQSYLFEKRDDSIRSLSMKQSNSEFFGWRERDIAMQRAFEKEDAFRRLKLNLSHIVRLIRDKLGI